MIYTDPHLVRTLQVILEFLGTFAFAISGIRHAAQKRFDWFGGYVCGFAVAIGGGTIRDTMLGVRPFWMANIMYVLCTGLALFLVILSRRWIQRLSNAWFVFDTLGLALFTIAGIQKTIALGHPFWVAVIMGCITGVAGGVIRDVLLNNIPVIFHKEIYAVASVGGGLIYWALFSLGLPLPITVIFLYFNINHRELVLRIKHHIVNAFDKNEYIEDTLDDYQEEDDIIYDEYNSSNVNRENSNEQRYNKIKDKDLVVDIREFKEDEEFYDEEIVQRPTRKQPKLNKEHITVEAEMVNELVSEESYDNYQLPPVTLLNNPVKKQTITKGDVVEKSKILQSTFNNFGIEVKIVKAIVGPSITQFQILPTPGTKVSKIVNLSNDIALNLAAKDVRIEAPIPGKSLIGIEIPNTVNELVTMKEVFVNDEDNSPLSVALGKDVSGESIFTRIDKTPHLLIAGSTGSGKSVCVNTIITSILLKNKPDKVKLIMIDPKMVELSIYDGIPHLLTSVVTDPVKAADVLHKVVLEMENRYREFARARVRNMEGYNKIAAKDPEYKELPYIVVIIDELADLMMVSSKEVEESIARIAQKARAAGIHMIIATQRPSVDVITGVIKTNIPSRIAFAVSSSIDSRTILDKSGAETLLGKGDMLYLSADSSKPIRVQGAFLSDEEVEKVVDFVKSQSEAQYDPNMTPSEVSSQNGGSSGEDVDPLYKEVLLFIAKTQKASASLLQRRFKIGYNRAARIIDMLEEDGYIGPVDGSKPRKVFLEKEYAEDYE